jgi:hypothetical protein
VNPALPMQSRLARSSCSTREVPRDLLAAFLVFLLGLAPTLQLAHLATADHGHRFCDEHHQVEDLPHGAAVGWNRQPASSATKGNHAPTAQEGQMPQGQAHAACLFLNQATSRVSLPSPAQTPAAIEYAQGFVLVCSRQQDFVPCPLLLSAPKTSPPLVAA